MTHYKRSEVFDLVNKKMMNAYSSNNFLTTYKRCVELLHLIETNPRSPEGHRLDQRGRQHYILKIMKEVIEELPDKSEDGSKIYCNTLCKPTEHLKRCWASTGHRVSRLELARADLLRRYTDSDNKLQVAITKLNKGDSAACPSPSVTS